MFVLQQSCCNPAKHREATICAHGTPLVVTLGCRGQVRGMVFPAECLQPFSSFYSLAGCITNWWGPVDGLNSEEKGTWVLGL